MVYNVVFLESRIWEEVRVFLLDSTAVLTCHQLNPRIRLVLIFLLLCGTFCYGPDWNCTGLSCLLVVVFFSFLNLLLNYFLD